MKLLYLFSCVILTGCSGGFALQNNYEEDRNDCQSQAASILSSAQARIDNATLVKAFNDCMRGKGWDMGAPAAIAPASPKSPRDTIRGPHGGLFPYEEY